MNIFGNEEEEPQTENTRVISNSLGIDLGTLNTVIAKPSGDKFDLYQIPSVVAVKKDDPSEVLAVGEEAKKMLERTAGEGAGIVEAARGTLIHHYECDDNGLTTKANIVVATIQNNPAMEMGIQKVAKDYIKPDVEVDDSIFNLMEMVIRAYDPCLSCATHTMDSQMRLAEVDIVDSEGNLIKKF